MNGRSSKPRSCTIAEARDRLKLASDFLAAFDVLDLAEIPIGNDVLASNAIYAAIAAADAICCARRQERSASGNHNDAADLLKTIDKGLGDNLARVLGYKNNAAYGTRPTTDAEVKTCLRVAKQLVEAAQVAVQGARG